MDSGRGIVESEAAPQISMGTPVRRGVPRSGGGCPADRRRDAAPRRERPHRPHELPELRSGAGRALPPPGPVLDRRRHAQPADRHLRRRERHRHPTWSPDRTKIAYARGVSAANTLRHLRAGPDAARERHESEGPHPVARRRTRIGPPGRPTAPTSRSRRTAAFPPTGTSSSPRLQTAVGRPTSRAPAGCHRGQAGVGPDRIDHLLREGERTEPGGQHGHRQAVDLLPRWSPHGRSGDARRGGRRQPSRDPARDLAGRRQDLLRDRLPRRAHHRHQGCGAHGHAEPAGRRSR